MKRDGKFRRNAKLYNFITCKHDKCVLKLEISFEEFQKLDLRIGKITEANQIPGSRNLIRLMVDFGTETRQAVAGLMQWYQPQELVGKKCLFILNLQKRKVMGVESQCMILAAEDAEGTVTVLQPEKDVAEGSKIH
ncbi:methionine--tRNA ligase subunit beta [Candidatus Bathyarchaeota archaeon]|nr:methionine--tRNA ligase subunit beta [Candidatus Bathyarchaeota archaeon]